MSTVEERRELIDELEEEYALDAIQAPEGAIDWTEQEIRDYFESDGETLPAPKAKVNQPSCHENLAAINTCSTPGRCSHQHM